MQQTVKHHSKSRSSPSAGKSNAATPVRKQPGHPAGKTPGSANLSLSMSVPKTRAWPRVSEHLHLDKPAQICSPKKCEQNQKHFPQLKSYLIRVIPKRIQRWTLEMSYLLCKRWTMKIKKNV